MSQTTVHLPTRRAKREMSDWTPSLAECVARVYGIDPLTESHWRVISECREQWARSGKAPGLERLAEISHLSVSELESLFPAGQLALAWILAGVALPAEAPAVSSATRPPLARALVVDSVEPSVPPKQGGDF